MFFERAPPSFAADCVGRGVHTEKGIVRKRSLRQLKAAPAR